MKSSVETLSPTRVRLTVEVPFEDLRSTLDQAYKRIGAQVRVPGFRPGRVPPRLIDQRVGRGAVLQEAVESAVPQFYSDAVRENEVAVIGVPDVDVTELQDNDKLVFTAEVDVRPEFELPGYDGIEVGVDDVEVSDADVDEQLDGLRERFATLKGVERAVESGDYVSLDLAATVDGEPVPGGDTTGLTYEVGTDTLVPGIDEALVGMTEGEARTFDTELMAGDYAGRTAQVSVTVRSVKVKELPPADDDFAQLASEFDTLEELRADLRTRLERVKLLEQGVQARDKVLDALLERTPLELPEGVVQSEVDWRMQSVEEQLQNAGMSRERFLEEQEQSEEEFAASMRADAESAVRAQLVLDALAEKEEVGVSQQELSEQLVRRAQRLGISPDEYAQQVVTNNQLGPLLAEVRRGKALAVVLERAVITDASGRPVDLEQLRDQLPEDDIELVEPEDLDEEGLSGGEVSEDEVSEDEPVAVEVGESSDDEVPAQG